MVLAHFGDELAAAVGRCRNPVVVGLDPRWDKLPAGFRQDLADNYTVRAEAYEKFCRGVIDVVAPLVPAVKPQVAFFEECGPSGMVALANVMNYAREKGQLVILDGKRNDIGSTAEAYARGYLGRGSVWGADALTISPYLGADSLEPFVEVAKESGAGLFVLVKTSNPGGGMLQDQQIDGQPLYRMVAQYVAEQSNSTLGQSGYSSVGAVVGATYPDQLAELRSAMPNSWFLVPGYGSQGGTAKDTAHAFDSLGLGAVINNSRGIIFAHQRPEYRDRFGDSNWQDAVAAATEDMIAQLRAETAVGKL
ncbi:orotidine-5'-phosphate decarboxylase [Bythopirellula polymerisocia]|uniref:Orotidine 5'-phosphate decarboxylase n=1 Tax=Bythopirellula polymerisocia TaxID=2528003 RepID=A0A5C6CS63_9BACT|nr:orotidine-5'-phosphate decarboxylase [Bythopirellula polymerisocia]TWU27390.1 Orotidine 5'-phosphate decarboxylase [Bythopirellula polymerisocia]